MDVLERDDTVTGLDRCHIVADRLDDAGTLVAENDGEGALWILAGERVGICDRAERESIPTTCSSKRFAAVVPRPIDDDVRTYVPV